MKELTDAVPVFQIKNEIKAGKHPTSVFQFDVSSVCEPPVVLFVVLGLTMVRRVWNRSHGQRPGQAVGDFPEGPAYRALGVGGGDGAATIAGFAGGDVDGDLA